jgi:streptogramin lyase
VPDAFFHYRLVCCLTLLICCVFGTAGYAQEPGQNVNMVSGTVWPYGDPFLERQDEPSLAVSTRNPLHLLAGANDYRTVDLNLPELDVGEGTLATPTGEPWVGEYISIDGGAHWQSTLLPGYPQDTSTQGTSSPLHGFTTAADPVLASGTNGMFYYGGIAFNRGTSLGTVFVARFMDLNNKENGNIAENSFPIRYINTVPVAYGTTTPSDFLDKPAIATDIPRGTNTCSLSVTQADGTVVQQTIPAGNVYVAYANVATSSAGVVTSTIYFSRSTNCGVSWSAPIAISKGYAISQGATIAVDPETGIVYVAWRVIHNTSTANDGIAITASLNNGQSFLPAITLVSLPQFNLNTPAAHAFFDQGTTVASFRTTAYPALAVADSGIALIPGPLYLAWSQRGEGPNGEARIMMLAIPGNASITSSGFKPPTPFPIDNGAVTNDIGGTFPALTAGHQVMPSMTFNQGNLMVLYYDLRQDHTIGEFAPNVLNGVFTPDSNGNFYEETREQVEDFPTAAYSPWFIDDAGLTVRRHTIDLVLAQSTEPAAVPTFNYVRVSHYDFGLLEGEASTTFQQLKFDPPNLPMFEQGQGAFMGDYIGITGPPFVLVNCGSSQCWTYNNPSPPGVAGTKLAAPKPAPSSAVNFASWTTNQDVIPPPNGEWDTYTAIASGPSVYNPSTTVPGCQSGYEGDRNQNVYMSRISQGLLVSSPQVSKPLSSSIQRGFVLLVQNQTNGRSTPAGFVNYFRLTIANQPVNGFASFAQLVPPSPVPSPPFPTTNNGLPFPLTSVDVAIAPHTGIARTVYAVSSSPTANILVNVNEITGLGGTVISGGMSAFLLFNADGTVPTNLVDPNGQTGSNSITDVELHNPSVTAPSVTAPSVTAPSVTAPSVTAPSVTAPSVTAPSVTAPSVTAPSVTADEVANPSVTAPSVTAPSVTAAPLSDGTYTVTNTGNTTGSYNLSVTGTTATPLQLLLSQIYMTPQTNGSCELITQQQNITLSNVPNVPIITPGSSLPNPSVTAAPVTEPTFSLAPGDTAYITLRGNVTTSTMEQILNQVAPVIVPQAINSNNTTSKTPPTTYPPLMILTASLPPTDRNDAGYSVQLQAAGGKVGTYTWTIVAGALPPGIGLSPSGLISGEATTPGAYSVTIQVADTNSPPDTATESYTLNVSVTQLTTQTVMSAPDGVVGQAYVATPLTVTGGTTPYTFSATGLPPGLSINPSTGQITGTPTTANTGGSSVVVTATDSAFPTESQSYGTTIAIGAVIQISPATVPNGIIGVPYSAQLSATGGIGTLVFGPASLPDNGTLSSTGLITFSNPQASSVSFTVSVHDQAIPTQVQTASYTIQFDSAANLIFVTQPSNTIVNQSITPAVQVKAVDSSDAVLPGVSITLSLSTGPGTLGGTLTQTTNASGIATFSNLSINAAGTGDVLTAKAAVAGFTSITATSNPFNVPAPLIAAPTTFNLTSGVTYPPPTITLSATGGTPPYSWTFYNGLLDGLTINTNGTLSGTLIGAGLNYFDATVTDSGSPQQSTIGVYTLNIAAFPSITTTSLPGGTSGVAYTAQQLTASGGTLPLTWSVSAGSLPNGMNLSSAGVLSGTPTASGTFNFTVQVVDANGATATQALSLSIAAAQAQVCAPIPGAPISWWPFNGNALDIRGGRPGVLQGTYSFVPAEVGQGYKPGVEGSVVVAQNSSALPVFAFTIGAWIRVDAIDSVPLMQVLWKGDNLGTSSTTPYSLSVEGTGTFTSSNAHPTQVGTPGPGKVVVIVGNGDTELDLFSNATLSTGTFYYVAVAVDGYYVNLYINGAIDTQTAEPPMASSSNPLQIGGIQGLSSDTFDGVINQLQIWPTAISQFQASTIYNAGSAGECQDLWFTEQATSKIGFITPNGATSQDYSTPTASSSPYSIAAGSDGNVWFTEKNPNNIGVFESLGGGTGIVEDQPTVPSGYGSSSAYGAWGITSGPDGNLWFTESFCEEDACFAGSITPGGTINLYLTPTDDITPEGITAGPDGNLWFTESGEEGGEGSAIAQMTTAGTIAEFPTPTADSVPVSITTGGDGNLWFTESAVNQIGVITTAGKFPHEYPIPAGLTGVSIAAAGTGYQNGDVVTVVQSGASGGTLARLQVNGSGAVTAITITSIGTGYSVANNLSTTGGHGTGLTVNVGATANTFDPAGITLGPDGNVWFTAYDANNIIEVTPAGQFTAYGVPVVGNPESITEGPDGNIWYTDNLNNAIAQLVPSTGVITEFPTPTSSSGPWGIGIGPTIAQTPAPPTGVSGVLNPGGVPQITWTASTSTVLGYNVYRSAGQNGPFTLANTSLVTGTTFPDLNVPIPPSCGVSYTFYYVVTAVGTGNWESPYSGETSAIVVYYTGGC